MKRFFEELARWFFHVALLVTGTLVISPLAKGHLSGRDIMWSVLGIISCFLFALVIFFLLDRVS